MGAGPTLPSPLGLGQSCGPGFAQHLWWVGLLNSPPPPWLSPALAHDVTLASSGHSTPPPGCAPRPLSAPTTLPQRAHPEPPPPPALRDGQQPVSGTAGPGVVQQGKSSRGSVDTTKTCSDPQRVRLCKGERPIGQHHGLVPTPPSPRPPSSGMCLGKGPAMTVTLSLF